MSYQIISNPINTQRLDTFHICLFYIQKTWVLNFCLFAVRGLPQPLRKTNRETPTLEYIVHP